MLFSVLTMRKGLFGLIIWEVDSSVFFCLGKTNLALVWFTIDNIVYIEELLYFLRVKSCFLTMFLSQDFVELTKVSRMDKNGQNHKCQKQGKNINP